MKPLQNKRTSDQINNLVWSRVWNRIDVNDYFYYTIIDQIINQINNKLEAIR